MSGRDAQPHTWTKTGWISEDLEMSIEKLSFGDNGHQICSFYNVELKFGFSKSLGFTLCNSWCAFIKLIRKSCSFKGANGVKSYLFCFFPTSKRVFTLFHHHQSWQLFFLLFSTANLRACYHNKRGTHFQQKHMWAGNFKSVTLSS